MTMYAMNVHTVTTQSKFQLVNNNKKYNARTMAALLGTYKRTANTIAIPRPVLYSATIDVRPSINMVLT